MMNAPARPVCSGVPAQVLTLFDGTLLTQIIAFVAQTGIVRLCTDTGPGYLGILTSAATLGAVVVGARFDLGIVLPTPGNGALARPLTDLASRCVLVVSVLATPITAAAWPWVSARYGNALAGWMLAVGVSILFLVQGQVCSYWLTRHRRFQATVSSPVVRALGITVLQLVCGFVASGGPGAVIGATIAGQGTTVAYLSWRARGVHERQDTDPTFREVASRYRKIILVGVSNVAVDVLCTSTIPMLIATYSVAALGQLNLAWLALQAPVAPVAGVLSQVYLPRLSDTPPGEMTRVALCAGGIALACSIPVFALLARVSPAIFPFVFGARWEAARYFVRSLAPRLTLTVATPPLLNVFVAIYHQRRMLAFVCVHCAAPLAWLAYNPCGVETMVAVLRALMAVLSVGMFPMAVVAARIYDRGDVTRPVIV